MQPCAGLQPIPQSYCTVISAFVAAGNMDTGRAVFNSMQRAGHDARQGWLAFAKAAFVWGCGPPLAACAGSSVSQAQHCQRSAALLGTGHAQQHAALRHDMSPEWGGPLGR